MGNETTTELLKLANAAAASAENLRALALYRQAHLGERSNLDALMGIALSATRLREPSEANAAYIQLIEIYIRTNQMRHAASAIARVLSTEPDHPLALRFATFVSSKLAPKSESSSDTEGISQRNFGRGSTEQRMARGSVQLEDSRQALDLVPAVAGAPEHADHDAILLTDADIEFADDFADESGINERNEPTVDLEAVPKPLFTDEDTAPVPKQLLEHLTKLSIAPAEPSEMDHDSSDAISLTPKSLSEWEAQTAIAIAAANAHVRQNNFGISMPARPAFESQIYPSIDERAVGRSNSNASCTNEPANKQQSIQARRSGRTELDSVIETSPLLATLGPECARELLVRSEIIQWKPGQTVALQGHELATLFVVLRGEVVLERRARRGEVSVQTVGVGDFFGEGALLSRTDQIATARTASEAIIAEVPTGLAEQHLCNKTGALTVMCQRLRERLVTILLAHDPRLAGLKAVEKNALSPCLALTQLQPGEVMIADGSIEPMFFFVMSGELETWGPTHSARLFPVSVVGRTHEQIAAGDRHREVSSTRTSWLLGLSGVDFDNLPFQVRQAIAQIAER